MTTTAKGHPEKPSEDTRGHAEGHSHPIEAFDEKEAHHAGNRQPAHKGGRPPAQHDTGLRHATPRSRCSASRRGYLMQPFVWRDQRHLDTLSIGQIGAEAHEMRDERVAC